MKPYICSYIGLGASGAQNNAHSIKMKEDDNIVIVMGWPLLRHLPRLGHKMNFSATLPQSFS